MVGSGTANHLVMVLEGDFKFSVRVFCFLANVPTEESTRVIVPAVTAGVQQEEVLRTQLDTVLRIY